MDRKSMQKSIIYLIDKYSSEREELKQLIISDKDSVKYVLSQIDYYKIKEYDQNDLDLIQDIVFYYV